MAAPSLKRLLLHTLLLFAFLLAGSACASKSDCWHPNFDDYGKIKKENSE